MALSRVFICCFFFGCIFVASVANAEEEDMIAEGADIPTMYRALRALNRALQAASSEGGSAGRFRRGLTITGSSSTNSNTNLSSGDKCVVVRPDGTVVVIPCDRLSSS